MLEGQWAEKSGVTLPYTIGHEKAGWVHAIGDAVTTKYQLDNFQQAIDDLDNGRVRGRAILIP